MASASTYAVRRGRVDFRLRVFFFRRNERSHHLEDLDDAENSTRSRTRSSPPGTYRRGRRKRRREKRGGGGASVTDGTDGGGAKRNCEGRGPGGEAEASAEEGSRAESEHRSGSDRPTGAREGSDPARGGGGRRRPRRRKLPVDGSGGGGRLPPPPRLVSSPFGARAVGRAALSAKPSPFGAELFDERPPADVLSPPAAAAARERGRAAPRTTTTKRERAAREVPDRRAVPEAAGGGGSRGRTSGRAMTWPRRRTTRRWSSPGGMPLRCPENLRPTRDERCEQLSRYGKAHGTTRVPYNKTGSGRRVSKRREISRKFHWGMRIPGAERQRELRRLGFNFNPMGLRELEGAGGEDGGGGGGMGGNARGHDDAPRPATQEEGATAPCPWDPSRSGTRSGGRSGSLSSSNTATGAGARRVDLKDATALRSGRER